jgi:hypothetical protein
MSTYDKIMHAVGQGALAVIGFSLTMPKTIPVWLLAACTVIASIAGATTNAVTQVAQKAFAKDPQ